jgi:alpha-L-rhamnosidase
MGAGDRKKVFYLILLLLAITAACIFCIHFFLTYHTNVFRITALKTNHMDDPIGIDSTPVFSWQMQSDVPGQEQMAYRIMLYDAQDCRKDSLVWDSGMQKSDLSAAVKYAGKSLQPCTRYYYRVHVWNAQNKDAVSDTAFFETGLMQDGFGDAHWISAGTAEQDQTKTKADPGLTAFSIDADFKCGKAAAGITFGAAESIYDSQYVCEVDDSGDMPKLLILREADFLTRGEKSFDLESSISDDNVWHHIKISVNDKQVDVFLDKKKAAEATLEAPVTPGKIGFYHDRSAKEALFDNLKVTSNGKTLLSEDFSDQNNTVFSPWYIRVKDGYAIPRAGITLAGGSECPAPMFRKDFRTNANIKSARLYASALGIMDIYLNGKPVSDNYFEPGVSNYNKNIYYCTYDVTKYIHDGDNAFGVILGHGWYDRAAGTMGEWGRWGNMLAFKGKLRIVYNDGTIETIDSDLSWLSRSDGPVRNDDMYQGEFYDASREIPDWTEPGQNSDGWNNVQTDHVTDGSLNAKMLSRESEPVRSIQTLHPLTVTEPRKGVYVYDFGQNFSGVCSFRLHENRGTAVTCRYGELLNADSLQNSDDVSGTVWTTNQLSASNTDVYICKGGDEEDFQPHYVYRGFRYLQVTGPENALPLEDITAHVLFSNIEQTGSFSCSDDNLNRIFSNILWSQKSNYVGNPSDCPQRDERFGWTGDAQVFTPAASYNMDIYDFMRNYLQKMRDGQRPSGEYPDMVPVNYGFYGDNGWADAGVLITWQLYQQYGDPDIILENLDAMCHYVDFLVQDSTGYIRNEKPATFGDFAAVNETPKDLVSTAQCTRVSDLLSKMAEAVGRPELAAKYSAIANNYRTAWQKKYLQADGSIDCWSQTAYTLALAWDLCPQKLIPMEASNLKTCMDYAKNTIATGYIGTGYLLPTLRKYGSAETAYATLMNDQGMLWKDMIDHHATTMFEKWGTFENTKNGSYSVSGSLNHAALGSIGWFYYHDILGIQADPDHPGFKQFILAPAVTDRLTWAEGSYDSAYGKIKSRWERNSTATIYTFTIPANTSAQVMLPVGNSGKFTTEGDTGETVSLIVENGLLVGTLESGDYRIVAQNK